MSRVRSIAPFAAVVVGLVTLGLSLRCGAGGELKVGSALTGVLAATWRDSPELWLDGRMAKFVLLTLAVGMSVFLFTSGLNSSRCT